MLKSTCFSVFALFLFATASFAASPTLDGTWSILQEGNEGCASRMEVSCSDQKIDITLSATSTSTAEAAGSTPTAALESFYWDSGARSDALVVTNESKENSCYHAEARLQSSAETDDTVVSVVRELTLNGAGHLVYIFTKANSVDGILEDSRCEYQRE